MDTSSEAVSYYIYFRIRADIDTDAAAAGIRAMQLALARTTGVEGRLLRRLHDAYTWMEVYEAVGDPGAFEHALDAAVAAHELGAMIEAGSARHMERFIECA